MDEDGVLLNSYVFSFLSSSYHVDIYPYPFLCHPLWGDVLYLKFPVIRRVLTKAGCIACSFGETPETVNSG